MNNRRITRASVDRSGNRYCGPLVLAALLGGSTAEAAAKVRAATDSDRTIKGMHNREMLQTLAANGYTVAAREVPKHYVEDRGFGEPSGVPSFIYPYTWYPKSAKHPNGLHHCDGGGQVQFCPLKLVGPTLAAWLRQRPDKAGTYLINVTGHYVLVVGRKFVDTRTHGEWVSLAKAPGRRARVENVWQVSR